MTSELELLERGFVKQLDGSWAKKASLQACQQASISDPVDDESELHADIIKFLTEKRWPYIHSRMDKRSTIGVGVQDFTIFGPNGITLKVECKSGKKKLDPEQVLNKLRLEANGHTVSIIYNYKQFKALISATYQNL